MDPEFFRDSEVSEELLHAERDRIEVALKAAATLLDPATPRATFDYKLAARAMFGATDFDPRRALYSKDERDIAAAEYFNQALKLEDPEHEGAAILVATSKGIRIGRLVSHISGIFQPVQFSSFGAGEHKSGDGEGYFGWYGCTRIRVEEVASVPLQDFELQEPIDLVTNCIFTSFSTSTPQKLRADYINDKSDSILVGDEIDLIFSELTNVEKAKVKYVIDYQKDTPNSEFQNSSN